MASFCTFAPLALQRCGKDSDASLCCGGLQRCGRRSEFTGLRLEATLRVSRLAFRRFRGRALTDKQFLGPGQGAIESRSAQALATFCSPQELKWKSSYRSRSPSKASELTPLLRLAAGSGSASCARATGLSAKWKRVPPLLAPKHLVAMATYTGAATPRDLNELTSDRKRSR